MSTVHVGSIHTPPGRRTDVATLARPRPQCLICCTRRGGRLGMSGRPRLIFPNFQTGRPLAPARDRPRARAAAFRISFALGGGRPTDRPFRYDDCTFQNSRASTCWHVAMGHSCLKIGNIFDRLSRSTLPFSQMGSGVWATCFEYTVDAICRFQNAPLCIDIRQLEAANCGNTSHWLKIYPSYFRNGPIGLTLRPHHVPVHQRGAL